MNRDEAMQFLEKEIHGILISLLPGGMPHPTPIIFAPMNGGIEISSGWDRVKTKNLQRDPRSSLCAITKDWRPYLCVEGNAALLEDPDGQKNLALYRRITGRDPDDMEEYLQAMKDERRMTIRLSMDRIYPLSG